jgi:SAM-dependent methyltransferase
MEKNYYKEYYHLERQHWWFTARAQILMSHVETLFPNRRDLRILNVGVATGRTSELLQQFGNVESVEYDSDCYAFVRDEVKIPVVQGSILALPYADQSFDLVCAFDVIEHVDDDATAVREMQRVARLGGVVCVTVPAFMFLWSEHDVVNHHFRRYSSRQLRTLFEQQAQLSPIFHSFFNTWLFFPIALFRLLAKILPRRAKTAEQTASDFGVMQGSSMVNRLFYRLFLSENALLRRRIAMPVGVSLLSSWRRMG